MTMKKNGFTLLELLLVVAIMGMLGVSAAAGYNQLVRGISERGTVASVAAVLRSAKERAQIDRQPTAVFCYNRLLREKTGTDEAAVAVGCMVSVRRAGRISYVRGQYLFDEFNDLDHTYETDEGSNLSNRKGMRLYKFGGRNMNMEYSIVADAVSEPDSGITLDFFSEYGGTTEGLDGNTGTLWSSAFFNLGSSDYEPGWKVGDAYGFVFAEMQLPHGFVFDGNIPTEAGKISTPKAFYFDPEEDNAPQIDVWWTRPDEGGTPQRGRKAGTAKADDSAV